MIYCMSDIHGEADRFHAMLDLIHFSSDDTLYIIGDVIDRYSSGLDILHEIMETPNMVMLLGNHEQMCFDTLGPISVYGSRAMWQQNGGSKTYHELVYAYTAKEKNRVLEFIRKLPNHLDIEVDGRKFYLVHGKPSDYLEDRIWERPKVDDPPPFEDCTAIVGHTPVCFLTGNKEETYKIWHGNGIIVIDCGCGMKTEHRRLACLRLDDMAEFYV